MHDLPRFSLFTSKQLTFGRIDAFLFDTPIAIHYKQRENIPLEGDVFYNR